MSLKRLALAMGFVGLMAVIGVRPAVVAPTR